MLSNFHTHTTFCDGENTPEEIVLYAIGAGFDVIGFSGHGYTDFDLSYCMTDTAGYISEINRLKTKYQDKIQIYLGTEEDAYSLQNRNDFDYIIGSLHYIYIDNTYLPIDSDYGYLKKCLEKFNNDPILFANAYYRKFCEYIKERKPDIVGHFDLITKFDDLYEPVFLNNGEYLETASKYMLEALKNDVIFEVNTNAVANGIRKNPYPDERLLHLIKKNDGKIVISSDSHKIETLSYGFGDVRKMLMEIGFQYTYTILNGEFVKIPL